jgi:hypothetical protein
MERGSVSAESPTRGLYVRYCPRVRLHLPCARCCAKSVLRNCSWPRHRVACRENSLFLERQTQNRSWNVRHVSSTLVCSAQCARNTCAQNKPPLHDRTHACRRVPAWATSCSCVAHARTLSVVMKITQKNVEFLREGLMSHCLC